MLKKCLLVEYLRRGLGLVATPFDLLKVQYITDTNNKNRTIMNSFQNIIQKNGLFGLYKGVSPNITRALCVLKRVSKKL